MVGAGVRLSRFGRYRVLRLGAALRTSAEAEFEALCSVGCSAVALGLRDAQL